MRTKHHILMLAPEGAVWSKQTKYQSGHWVVGRGRSFRPARFGGNTYTIKCPLVGSKGDKLTVNHGVIASANMYKVNNATSRQVNLWDH